MTVTASLAVALLMAGCSGSEPSAAVDETPSATAAPACTVVTDGCALRTVADQRNVYAGVAVDPDRLSSDERYATAVAREFNSITLENAMKWTAVQPMPGNWDFADADAAVAFAEAHDMAVRGHTLVWGQAAGNGLPDWVADIDDPVELEAVVGEHITTLVGRYRGRVDRWDVVNEPLESGGVDLDQNHFLDVLGPGYIAMAFRLAHEADPAAELYLNEHSIEHLPAKTDALIALVDQLLADDVPIDGVGIQAHQFAGVGPPPGELSRLITEFRARGLDVAITELDVPLTEGSGVQVQADIYHQVVAECIQAGCREITVWGLDDAHTWLDDFLGRDGTNPLLFDDEIRPKPAYDAVMEALHNE